MTQHQDEVIRLGISRLKSAIQVLANACHTPKRKWYKYECYFQLTDDGVHLDDIVFKEADKLCRRTSPRFMVNDENRTPPHKNKTV